MAKIQFSKYNCNLLSTFLIGVMSSHTASVPRRAPPMQSYFDQGYSIKYFFIQLMDGIIGEMGRSSMGCKCQRDPNCDHTELKKKQRHFSFLIPPMLETCGSNPILNLVVYRRIFCTARSHAHLGHS